VALAETCGDCERRLAHKDSRYIVLPVGMDRPAMTSNQPSRARGLGRRVHVAAVETETFPIGRTLEATALRRAYHAYRAASGGWPRR
jgi:hypothetical protein